MRFSRLSSRKKLKGTVGLLKQSLLIIATTALVGLIILYVFSYALGLIVFGVSLFAIGGIIIAFRRIIWDDYVKSYRDRSGLIASLSRPTKIAYWLNVVIIWPLMMIIGVTATIAGILAS